MKKAFTLAEVLITLVIIGVVAALTIPVLMNHYEKVEEISRLKEFYSSFSQLLVRFKGEGGNLEQDTGSCWQTGCQDNDFVKFLNSQFKDGVCYPKDSATCWGANARTYKTLGGGAPDDRYPDLYYYFYAYLSYQMKNGTMFALNREPARSNFSVVVDVNGPNQGPNIVGRDTFHFIAVSPDYVLEARPFNSPYWTFAGSSDVNADCNPDSSASTGMLCAKKIMNESWEMNY